MIAAYWNSTWLTGVCTHRRPTTAWQCEQATSCRRLKPCKPREISALPRPEAASKAVYRSGSSGYSPVADQCLFLAYSHRAAVFHFGIAVVPSDRTHVALANLSPNIDKFAQVPTTFCT